MWWSPKKRTTRVDKKKTTCPVKKSAKKKVFRFDGPHGNRPFSPSRRSLRPGLPTRSTPPFAPHYDKRSGCALYNNHVKNPECTINFFSVLLAVLRYCPGSTAHRCPIVYEQHHNTRSFKLCPLFCVQQNQCSTSEWNDYARVWERLP